MEHVWWKALRRILDATAFENVGHLREFEELLERSPRPEGAGPDDGEAKAADDRIRVANDDFFS